MNIVRPMDFFFIQDALNAVLAPMAATAAFEPEGFFPEIIVHMPGIDRALFVSSDFNWDGWEAYLDDGGNGDGALVDGPACEPAGGEWLDAIDWIHMLVEAIMSDDSSVFAS